MTDNQIIAEFMGFKNVKCLLGGNVLYGEPPDDYNEDNPSNPHTIRIPDYSSDLAPRNLLHEVEWKLAAEGLWDVYIWELEDMVRKSGSSEDCKQAKLRGCIDCKGTIYEPCSYVAFLIAIANAPTRVKAIVETLKGRE